jgi:dTDP-4-amino-4,6-dideoxygalactose transaminase
MKIPFNKPHLTGKELHYISEAHASLHLSGDGQFTKKCQAWLEERIGCKKALLTYSCTAALEMAAILAGIEAGDEVIMPSYTFVSTANAFVLRGGIPVFVDIRPDTLNIDETKIEAAITDKTKAIVPVHYASVACDLDSVMDIAKQYNLLVIEDAAQAILSRFRGHTLGRIGHLACLSFHETKNLISGEGGALLINEPRFIEHAEIVWEKGTNRKKFFRGEVDKYTWVEIGSSYLPSDINAAFLWAQMENAESINRQRLRIWDWYHNAFAELENQGKVRRPVIPSDCMHNAHMYYLLLPNLGIRNILIEKLKSSSIQAVFHYVPLHSSPAGRKYGRAHGSLSQTEEISERLVRLPLWIGMTEDDLQQVARAVHEALS